MRSTRRLLAILTGLAAAAAIVGLPAPADAGLAIGRLTVLKEVLGASPGENFELSLTCDGGTIVENFSSEPGDFVDFTELDLGVDFDAGVECSLTEHNPQGATVSVLVMTLDGEAVPTEVVPDGDGVQARFETLAGVDADYAVAVLNNYVSDAAALCGIGENAAGAVSDALAQFETASPDQLEDLWSEAFEQLLDAYGSVSPAQQPPIAEAAAAIFFSGGLLNGEDWDLSNLSQEQIDLIVDLFPTIEAGIAAIEQFLELECGAGTTTTTSSTPSTTAAAAGGEVARPRFTG